MNWQVILIIILGTNKESEDEGSDFGLKNSIQELSKDKEIEGEIGKDLADFANKVWQNPIDFKKLKTKMKPNKKNLT